MENLIAMWASVPTEFKVLLVPIVIWLVDWAVTLTPTPLDNMIWRWYKGKKVIGK